MNYHNDEYANYLCLYNAIKTHSIHANNALIVWLEKHKEKSRPDMHKLLLRHELSDIPLSILNDITDDYPHLIDYIYNKNPILGRLNKLMLYLLRLSIPKPDVYCHLDNFIDSIFLMKTQKKLSLVNSPFSFNSNVLDIMNRYNQLLALSPIHYQIPFEQFVDKYQLALNALYFALSTRYEKTLLSLLNTSVMQLHDFLSTVTQFINHRQFDIIDYLPHYILYQLGKTLKKPASLKKSLTYLLFKLNSSRNNAMDDTVLFFQTPGINDHVLLEHFHVYTVTTLSKNLGIQLTKKTNAFSFKELSTLSLAYQQHQMHSYIPILKTLITYHCLNHSVFDFLHDNNQESSLGKEIASHNRLTQQALVAAGVNPSILMNYPYKKTVYIFGKKTRICNELTLEIWLVSCLLLEQINLDINENKCLIKIQNNLKNFISQISKKLKGRPLSEDDNDMLSFIRNDANIHLLATMLKECKALLLNNSLKQSLIETLITDFSNKIKQLSESLDSKKYSRHDHDWKKPERYTLKIWDKTDSKTFFLGDQVGCCLAAKNGPQFPAIIERILDDAMQIMMIIDENTQEAVAGMWLYVAQDTATEHAYLVANFTEMRSGIAKKQPVLRDALLIEMLKFTKEFAGAMKIPFVMAPLDYGCLDNWQFNLIKHTFKKIGFMSLGANYTPYYIKSIEKKIFYHYDETKINEIYPEANNSIIESRTEVISSALNRAPISPLLHKHGIFKRTTEGSVDNSQSPHLLYKCNPS